MLRLMHMLESAWNITEPVQLMVHVEHAHAAVLHEDHQHMLDAFLAGDADGCCRRSRFTTSGSTPSSRRSPTGSGLIDRRIAS